MNLLPWKKTKPQDGKLPTSAELAAELAEVEKAYQSAVSGVDAANAKFIESGEDADAQAVIEAKKQIQVLELHLERARKMLEAAKERETEARLKAEAEARERAKEEHAALLDQDEKLEDEEARLLLEVVKLRAKRWKVRSDARDVAAKFVPHDHPDAYRFLDAVRPPCDRVLKTLEASTDGIGGLRGLVSALGVTHDTYNHNQTHVDWAKLLEHPPTLKVCGCRPKPKLGALPPPSPKDEPPRAVTLTIAKSRPDSDRTTEPGGGWVQNPERRLVGAEREAG